MSWVKLDDQWMDHPKIIKAGRDARDMWLASITWCSKYLTDGYFPIDLLPSLAVAAGIDVANCQTFATRLLEVGLWENTDKGLMVHDYLDYNPSKEQALATRGARKEAGSAGGRAKASKIPSKTLANDVAKDKQNPAPSPSPSPSLNKQDDVTGGINNIADKPAAEAAPPPSPLSPGQTAFLRAFNAKRYKNNIQRDAVLKAENKYGIECLSQFIDWSATKGMAMGQAIGAMEKTLPRWGKTKPQNGNGRKPDNFEKSKSVLTEFMERAETEELHNGNQT